MGFHGMELTRDKQCSIIKKWQTKIEAHVDCTTTDGYKLRLFCVGFTKRRQNQIKKTTYAQTAQVHAIRKVKVLKKPRFDISRLLEMHGEGGKVVTKKDGETVVTDNYEPPVLENV